MPAMTHHLSSHKCFASHSTSIQLCCSKIKHILLLLSVGVRRNFNNQSNNECVQILNQCNYSLITHFNLNYVRNVELLRDYHF